MKTSEILEALKNGKTAYFCTYTQVKRVTHKTVEAFEKAGMSLMKDAEEGWIFLRQGRSMVRYPAYNVKVQ